MLIAVLALVAQSIAGTPAYTTIVDAPGHLGLALPTGRYTIELGAGCDGLTAGVNVTYLAGSRGVGQLETPGIDGACNVYIDGRLADDPCATIDDACDVAAESDQS